MSFGRGGGEEAERAARAGGVCCASHLLVEDRLLVRLHLRAVRRLLLLAAELRPPVLLPHVVEDAVLALLHLEHVHLLADLVRARRVRRLHDRDRLLLAQRVARHAPLTFVLLANIRKPFGLTLFLQFGSAPLHARLALARVLIEFTQLT